ncbi:hypothetical protein [Sphingobacterium bambusae]|uniref:Outer membrane protein beta-barrel domain-containing protein n=1 Tax=Sphingobacterium bambusae TaxID=662858 RepID=A0ABW6BCK5_9SPHI|nr:hypothetical protein [Sphingobacterium bambusae]WPL48857.1 hypothetical protein SCB77_00050 [Sphingobacterium bambusae]
MNLNVFYFIIILLCAAGAAKGQVASEWPRHNIGAGPLVGYNLDSHGLAYGANLLYEYRPFEKVSFISLLTYERTRLDASGINYAAPGHTPILGQNRFEDVYSLSLGMRYYARNFYLAGTAGLGYDKIRTTTQNGGVIDGGDEFGFYKSLAVGYQIALKNEDIVELESGLFGTKRMKLGGTVRYKFMR